AGQQAGQRQHLLLAGETQALDLKRVAGLAAIELAIGRQDGHDEPLTRLEEERLGAAGQRCPADGGGLFAGGDWLVAQYREGDAALLQPSVQPIKNAISHAGPPGSSASRQRGSS